MNKDRLLEVLRSEETKSAFEEESVVREEGEYLHLHGVWNIRALVHALLLVEAGEKKPTRIIPSFLRRCSVCGMFFRTNHVRHFVCLRCARMKQRR